MLVDIGGNDIYTVSTSEMCVMSVDSDLTIL